METQSKDKVYVIGHKNPDTDSICSSICYAYLKRQITGDDYVPMRAGEINAETKYVLNAFSAAVPEYMENVSTQVKDVEYRHIDGVDGEISIKNAWEILSESGATTLPSVNENGNLVGLITVRDIAMTYMEVYDNRVIASAHTPYKNIINTLSADLIVGDEKDYVHTGKVLISAANPDMMENYIEQGDIVILGNRYESQLCAIEMDAQCIIICDGAVVSKTITKLAEDHNCSIIRTPYDTYTAARLINQSIPIRYFMKKDNLITFSTEDYIRDIRTVMAGKRHQYYPVLNEYGKYVGLISQRNYLNANPKKVILVDHNEHAQAVDGIEEVQLLEIIDHHRLGGLQTMNPVYFRNQPLGCTATIIYQMYQENRVQIPKNIAGLLMAAIISDTLMFRSPTCTSIDRSAAEKLSEICGVEIEEFAIDMFSAGSDMSSRTPKEIFNQDKKKFQVGDHGFMVSQINSMNAIELEEIKEKLIPYLEEKFDGLGVEMCYVMLTNIVKEDTELLCFGEKAREVILSAFQLPSDMEDIVLKGLVSRKKQLIPSIVTVLQQM